ncbi:MAG: hypothetical protein LBL21_04910 [Rickettsiales bacterium]|jgi:hypothetical protein|nr:hypothetical protein [Rickettsiales bacterium]
MTKAFEKILDITCGKIQEIAEAMPERPHSNSMLVEEAKSKVLDSLNIALGGSYVLGHIKLQKKAWQFAPYDIKSPIVYLDALVRDAEPNGSKIIRFLAGNLDKKDRRDADFPCLSIDAAKDMARAAGRGASVSMTYPKMTVVTPVGDISSIGIFRENPNFDENMANFAARRISGKKYAVVGGIAREYYEGFIKSNGWKALIDWNTTILFPHTDLFSLILKIDEIGADFFTREGESVEDNAKIILSAHDILNYYMPSFEADAKDNNMALHTAHKAQDTLYGDPGKKSARGLNHIATDAATKALNGFSDEARAHIIQNLISPKKR